MNMGKKIFHHLLIGLNNRTRERILLIKEQEESSMGAASVSRYLGRKNSRRLGKEACLSYHRIPTWSRRSG